MGNIEKQYSISLGVRVGLVFLAALASIIMVVYIVMSQSFHSSLTNYSLILVESMMNQGVTMVEAELSYGRGQSSMLADLLVVPDSPTAPVVFPDQSFADSNTLRVVYVDKNRTVASDSRQRDIRSREDIAAAMRGEASIYGPCFDEDGQFVVCFTSPVVRGGKIVGAFGIEKDGYLFSELIRDIRFVESGESYIINAEGTDIAVSDPNHIDWVNTQYNGREILAQTNDSVTRSIVELEQKGLDGETGTGTYMWNNGLCYVSYTPIPSTGWVLLAGLRDEEIVSMARIALYSSITDGPTLQICYALFILLTIVIVVWIISSTKKNAEINEKLTKIANLDALTGLYNRRYLESDLSQRWSYPVKMSGQAAVFMLDIDDFKKYNDFYGHLKGDDCLRKVAAIFKNAFSGRDSYAMRYGGEEFVATVFLLDRHSAAQIGEEICRAVLDEKLPDSAGGFVTVSVGVCHVNLTSGVSLYDCIKKADTALYQAKHNGKNQCIIVDAEDCTPGAVCTQEL